MSGTIELLLYQYDDFSEGRGILVQNASTA
jgi:hypothetical protein